jgi:prepilin signal peptidase PulO-like enzyme (type II secretory pathway)
MSAAMWIAAVCGLAIGSFLNVLIARYRPEANFFSLARAGGRSRCPQCGRTLTWHELIPIASFIMQRGACRGCRGRIAWHYPLVEALGAASLLLPFYIARAYSFPIAYAHPFLIGWLFAGAALLMIALAAIDMRYMIIPDEIVIALGVAGLGIAYWGGGFSFMGEFAALAPDINPPFARHIAGGLVGFGLLGALAFASRGRAMGMGDVKLAGALGLIIGFPDILMALAASFLAGGIFSAGFIAAHARRSAMKAMVPFGPFLVLGFWIAVFFGRSLLAWYFSFV